jgi:hypothetical protein
VFYGRILLTAYWLDTGIINQYDKTRGITNDDTGISEEV